LYESYWEIKEQPFRNTMNPNFFYYSPEHEEALVRMLLTMTESKGLMMMTGQSGIGKTFAGRLFMQEMRARGYSMGMIVNPNVFPTEFIQETLYAFGIEYRSNSKVDLLHRLESSLRVGCESGMEYILLVDEAQLMTLETLEELRLLMNLENDEKPLMTIYLIGQNDLWANVRRVPMLLQRVGVAYRMKALSEEETAKFLQHRMTVAGSRKKIFSDATCRVIFGKTNGIARQINDLAHLCLMVGSGSGSQEVDEKIVDEASRELVSHEVGDQFSSGVSL